MLEINLFTPLLVYLARADSKAIGSQDQYSEDRVMAALNILSQVTDGEKPTQNWILNNVKIDKICS